MGPQTYIDGAIKNLQLKLSKRNLVLQKTAKEPFPMYLDGSFNPKNPLPYSCRPELDVSPHLGQDDHTWFQQLIGILNWIVELGRIDTHNVVARHSAYLAAPQVGHIKAVLHVFACLKATNNKLIEFDKTLPELPDDNIDGDNASDINEKPPRMPRPLGNPVRISCYVDADHAGNQATRRSYTGIIMMINKAFVSSFSKRQKLRLLDQKLSLLGLQRKRFNL